MCKSYNLKFKLVGSFLAAYIFVLRKIVLKNNFAKLQNRYNIESCIFFTLTNFMNIDID